MLHPQKVFYMFKNYLEDQNNHCFAAMRFLVILVLAVFKVQGGESKAVYQEVPQEDIDFRYLVDEDDSSAPKFHPRNLEPLLFYRSLPSVGGYRDDPIPNETPAFRLYGDSVPDPYDMAVAPRMAPIPVIEDVINVGLDILFIPLAKLVSKFSAPAAIAVNYIHGLVKNSGYNIFEQARDLLEKVIKSVMSAILGDGVTATVFPKVVAFLRGAHEAISRLILPLLRTLQGALKTWLA